MILLWFYGKIPTQRLCPRSHITSPLSFTLRCFKAGIPYVGVDILSDEDALQMLTKYDIQKGKKKAVNPYKSTA